MVDRKQIIKILIVEDNPVDILMTERALNNLKIAYDFYVLRNGNNCLIICLDRLTGESTQIYFF